jgi:ubiquinone/menaquinone biosynthesis C-methylase UbiE
MKAAAFNFSGDDAKNYDDYLGPILFEPSAKELIKYLDRENIKSVLEISCGSGRLTRHLRNFFDRSVQLVATDISEDMIRVARINLADQDIEFAVADGQDLPFPDESFDCVICQYGLMFFPDQEKGIREAYRVSKKGGKYIFSTWDSTSAIALNQVVFEETIIPFFNSENADRYRTPFSLHDPVKLETLLRSGGFQNPGVKHIHFDSGMTNVENIVNGFLLKHRLGREVQEKDAHALEKTANDLRDRVIKKFGADNLVFDLKAFVSIGEK